MLAFRWNGAHEGSGLRRDAHQGASVRMTFSALDSAITGPLFATPEMTEVFSDRSRIAAMLRMEAALARAQGGDDLARAVEAIRPEELDVAALGRDTALAGVPVIPFVKAVQARLPPALERSFHKGAT